jgi:hypothetical protein
MFRRRSYNLVLKTFVLAALLAFPCAALAQRGGGGGHIGGGSPIGGPMGSGGRPTGVDNKDDLRDFHEVLAVQASPEQMAAFSEMLRNTAAAADELKAFEEQLQKDSSAAALAGRNKTLEDALESARILNKRFLEGFSSAQKNGLKIVTKRLVKSDSEVGQQAKAIGQSVEANAAVAQLANSAQNLDRALASFQRAQFDLGDEMSIQATNQGQNLAFNLIPVRNKVAVANQSITVTTGGVISKNSSEGGQNIFGADVTADMSDLQLSIAEVLRAQLYKAERCGERIAVQTADLTPQGAAGMVVVQLHYERWACATSFGRESVNEIVEGNGTIEVRLTPAVAEDGTLRMVSQIGQVSAGGLVGDSLRSGTLGEWMREKIAESILTVLRQGGDFRAALPTEARTNATLRRAQFQGTGSGKLMMILNGDIRVSDEQANQLISELGKASQEQTVPGPLLTRPATPQQAVSR